MTSPEQRPDPIAHYLNTIRRALGDVAVPTPPGLPAQENEPLSPNSGLEEIRTRCMTEALDIVAQLQTYIDKQLTAGQPLDEDTIESAGRTMGKMGAHAAQNRDLERAESYAATLAQLPDHDVDDALAKICIATIKAGSEPAREVLVNALETRTDTTRLFDGIIEACAENNVLADEWIDAYARTDEERWGHYMEYYGHMVKKSDNEMYDLMASEKARELLVEAKYSPKFVFTNTTVALGIVKDLVLRGELADNFRIAAAYPDIPIELNKVLRVGRTVLGDKDLATEPRVAAFAEVIERHVDYFRERGANMHDFGGSYLLWKCRLGIYQGMPAQTLMNYLRLDVEELREGMPDRPASPLGFKSWGRSQWGVDWLENMLTDYAAERYAEKGDFVSTKHFLATIAEEDEYVSALVDSLAKAKHPDHIEALVPNAAELKAKPYLNLPFQYTTLRLLESIGEPGALDGLEAFALQCAKTSDTDWVSGRMKDKFVKEVYIMLEQRDGGRAARFAKTVLPFVKGGERLFLSEALIRAGDAETARAAYDSIATDYSDPVSRARASSTLHDLWALAQSLEMAAKRQ